MVSDKAPQSSNAAHIRFMRLIPPIIPNVEFVRSWRLSRQQKAPADSDRCRTLVPTRCRTAVRPEGSPAGRAKATVFNVHTSVPLNRYVALSPDEVEGNRPALT